MHHSWLIYMGHESWVMSDVYDTNSARYTKHQEGCTRGTSATQPHCCLWQVCLLCVNSSFNTCIGLFCIYMGLCCVALARRSRTAIHTTSLCVSTSLFHNRSTSLFHHRSTSLLYVYGPLLCGTCATQLHSSSQSYSYHGGGGGIFPEVKRSVAKWIGTRKLLFSGFLTAQVWF